MDQKDYIHNRIDEVCKVVTTCENSSEYHYLPGWTCPQVGSVGTQVTAVDLSQPGGGTTHARYLRQKPMGLFTLVLTM